MGFFSKKSAPPPLTVVTEFGVDDAALQETLHAARAGDWRPTAALLSQAVDGVHRQVRIESLAGLSLEHPQWLTGWLADDPDGVDAHIVWATSAPMRAGEARGSAYAEHTSDEQFARMYQLNDEAEGVLRSTLEMVPNEPALQSAWLWHGIGSGVDAEEFEQRWQGSQRIDPYNRNSHNAALQYWCAKWYGSNEKMYEFARNVSTTAPVGSPLNLQILQAHLERWMRARDDDGADVRTLDAFMQSDEVGRDIDVVKQKWYGAPGIETDPFYLHDMSVLVFVLCQARRWPEAAEVFQRTNSQVFQYPWYYDPGLAEIAYRRAMSER